MKGTSKLLKGETPGRTRVRHFITDRYAYQTRPPIHLTWLLSELSCSSRFGGSWVLTQWRGTLKEI